MRSKLRVLRPTPRENWGTLNRRRLQNYRPNWNWKGFQGSDACLKWSFRDLENLERALTFVRHKRVVVQAGGNLGIFPKRLAEDFVEVHTFEPDPILFGWLKANAPEKNIFAQQAALGKSREPIRVSGERRDTSGRAAHEGLTHVAGAGEIPQILIDDLALRRCDLIYLDIEGYELNALQGAERTIETFRPVIVVEINGNCKHYGVTDKALRGWIRERGYKCRFTLNSDEVFVPL